MTTFRWQGGRGSVNFTATLGMRWGPAVERLREPADLARWFREAGMTGELVEISDADLSDALDLREALYALFTGASTDVALVNRWLASPVASGLLEVVSGKLTRLAPATDARGLLSLLARDGADLLTGPWAHRIRECEREDCSLLFVDESRAGARRWCSMETCGARSKMARYRARPGVVSG
jgi:predicted RNA-binding Zn ribbon-like protein